jgi:lipopolysaccharide/colanic/teichoic acid biosynthesis glycosyltransferase
MAFLDHPSKRITPAHRSRIGGLYERGGKRVFDLAVCLLLLPFVGFVILLLWWLATAIGSSGFFGHKRVGRNGVVFHCWKIRTMIANADRALLLVFKQSPDTKNEWEMNRKLENDPRVLPFGKFLRRTGLDELPQIWNVIRGDMSLVGPRPVTRSELSLFGDARKDYLSVRPGITGLWQVKARRVPCYIRRVKLDRRYARNVTFGQDLRILLWTLPVLFRATGR